MNGLCIILPISTNDILFLLGALNKLSRLEFELLPDETFEFRYSIPPVRCRSLCFRK